MILGRLVCVIVNEVATTYVVVVIIHALVPRNWATKHLYNGRCGDNYGDGDDDGGDGRCGPSTQDQQSLKIRNYMWLKIEYFK
jgi:hypothetical protein